MAATFLYALSRLFVSAQGTPTSVLVVTIAACAALYFFETNEENTHEHN